MRLGISVSAYVDKESSVVVAGPAVSTVPSLSGSQYTDCVIIALTNMEFYEIKSF